MTLKLLVSEAELAKAVNENTFKKVLSMNFDTLIKVGNPPTDATQSRPENGVGLASDTDPNVNQLIGINLGAKTNTLVELNIPDQSAKFKVMSVTDKGECGVPDVNLEEYTMEYTNNAKNFKLMVWLFGGLVATILIVTYLAIHFTK